MTMTRRAIERRFFTNRKDSLNLAFRKWRETTTIEWTVKQVVHNILEPHTAMVFKTIKQRIKVALQRQFMSSPREKSHILLLWSVLEPVLYYSNLDKSLPNGRGESLTNHSTRRVSALNLDTLHSE